MFSPSETTQERCLQVFSPTATTFSCKSRLCGVSVVPAPDRTCPGSRTRLVPALRCLF
jgi:hypothetical protein